MYRVTLYKDINDTEGTIIHESNRSALKLNSGNIAHGINTIDSFVYSMNMRNPGYLIHKTLKSLITVVNTKDGEIEFDGYMINQSGVYTEDGQYTKSIVCVSGLNYLKQSKQRFREFHDTTVRGFIQAVVNVHNSQVEPHKRFTLGEVTVTNSTDNVYRYTNQEMNTYDTLFDKIIDRIGGELRVRRVNGIWVLDLLESIGEAKQTSITVGRNLKSATRDENSDGTYTRWMIYGEHIESANPEAAGAALERTTIADVNGGLDYIDDHAGIAVFGINVGHVTFDNISDKNLLKQRGQQHVANYRLMRINNTVDALDLSLIGKDVDSYEVHNWYPLNNPGLSSPELVRIVEKRIDILHPEKNTLTIGETSLTASKYQANSNKDARLIRDLNVKVENQTRSIVSLRQSNSQLTVSYQTLQQSYNSLSTSLEIDDATGTSVALQNLSEAITNLGNEIVTYSPVTYEISGLMIPGDKIKLDNLQNYGEATIIEPGLLSSGDKSKLDLIYVSEQIDLNDILRRIGVLENGI